MTTADDDGDGHDHTRKAYRVAFAQNANMHNALAMSHNRLRILDVSRLAYCHGWEHLN